MATYSDAVVSQQSGLLDTTTGIYTVPAGKWAEVMAYPNLNLGGTADFDVNGIQVSDTLGSGTKEAPIKMILFSGDILKMSSAAGGAGVGFYRANEYSNP